MIALTAAGQLENYTVFDQKLKLARQLAELPTVPPHLLNAFANLNTEQIPRDLQKALTLLIRRTKKCYYPNLFRRSARLMKQQLVGLLKQSVKKRGTLKNQPIP